jgi:hypothetical protein
LLVAAERGGLTRLDISTPSNLVLLQQYPTPVVEGEAIAIAGTKAFVQGNQGVNIVDIADPENPVWLSSVNWLDGAPYDMAAQGNYVYVADCGWGLRVLDVSNPLSPVLVGSYRSGGYPFGVAVAGDYAYLASRGVFEVINVSNPTAPVLSGSYGMEIQHFAYDVEVAGDYAYIASQSGGLAIVNVSNPAQPSLAGALATGDVTYDLAVAGEYVYLAGSGGVSVVDVDTPSAPVLVGTYPSHRGSLWGITLLDHYAIAADDLGGALVLDVTNPAQPQLANYYGLVGAVHAAAASDGHAYLTSWANGLMVLSVQDFNYPSNPVLSNTSVREGLKNAAVGTVSADDADPDDVITFSLSGSHANYFWMDGNTLRTSSALSYSQRKTYQVRIIATDSHGLATSRDVTIYAIPVPKPLTLSGRTSADVVSLAMSAGRLQVTTNGAKKYYDPATISTLTIKLLGGADKLTVGSGVMGVRVYGGDGNDTLTGGSGGDMLDGGSGNDLLRGGGRRDTLYGQAGADRLYGGSGDDRLHGGSGSDTLYGESGNDELFAIDRVRDVLSGGTGADTAHWESTRDGRLDRIEVLLKT